MRFALILAIAMLPTPAALTAHPPTPKQAQAATDVSAAKKQKKPKKTKKAPKEEYLKAAPGTGPSGPKN